MAKQDDYIKTALRLPSDLHSRIQLAAEKSGRSMNSEIVERLARSIDGEALGMTTDLAAMLEALTATALTLMSIPDKSTMARDDRTLFDEYVRANEAMAKRLRGTHFTS